MRAKRAAEVVEILREIEREIACFYEGKEPGEVMEQIDQQINELRCALWHEMPRKFARIMDNEDGLPAGRGD